VSVQTRIPDIRAYKGTPGFAYLLLAANPDTPVSVLRTILDAIGQPYPKTWLYKRRALFEVPTLPPGTMGALWHLCGPTWTNRAQVSCNATQARRQMWRCDGVPYLDGNFVLIVNGMMWIDTNNKSLELKREEKYSPSAPLGRILFLSNTGVE